MRCRRRPPGPLRTASASFPLQWKHRWFGRALAFPVTGRFRGAFPPETYTVRDRTESRLRLQRQHMALLRRNAARQRIDIDLFHCGWAPALDHREPLVQIPGNARPRGGTAPLDAAG